MALTCRNVELLGRYSNRTKWTNQVQQALDCRRTVTETAARRGTVRRLGPEHVSALVAQYQAGATVYELAERFKINRKTVSEHLHRQGVEMRRMGLETQQVDEAVRLYEQGRSLAWIAQHHRVSAGTVWLQ
jgi:DNA-binding CsgD family transcriptional regulator